MMTIEFTRKILGNHSDDEMLRLLLFCLSADYREVPWQCFKAGPLCMWMQHDSSRRPEAFASQIFEIMTN